MPTTSLTPKVSVIVPVYNAEKYLEQCLDSILNQTLREIEIICVDDGSSDSSKAILNRYRQKDERLIIVEQANSGAGAARGHGQRLAKGKYLSFLDSDDFFEPQMLEKAYERCELDQAQICIFGTQYIDDTKSGEATPAPWKLKLSVLPQHRPFSWREIPERLFNFCDGCAWDKLFLASFIRDNEVEFGEYPNCEDTKFTFTALSRAERITWLDEVFVNYRTNQASSLTARLSKAPLCFVETYRYLKQRLVADGTYALLEKSFGNRALDCAYWTFNLIDDKATERLRQHMNDGVWEELGIITHNRLWYYMESLYIWLHHMLFPSVYQTFVTLIDEKTDLSLIAHFIEKLNRNYCRYQSEHLECEKEAEVICFYDHLSSEFKERIESFIQSQSTHTLPCLFIKRKGIKKEPWVLYNEAIDLARGKYIAFFNELRTYWLDDLLNTALLKFDEAEEPGVEKPMLFHDGDMSGEVSSDVVMRERIMKGLVSSQQVSFVRNSGVRFTPPIKGLPSLPTIQLFQMSLIARLKPGEFDYVSRKILDHPKYALSSSDNVFGLVDFKEEDLLSLGYKCSDIESINTLLKPINDFIETLPKELTNNSSLTPEEFLREIIEVTFHNDSVNQHLREKLNTPFWILVAAVTSDQSYKKLESKKKILKIKKALAFYSRKKKNKYKVKIALTTMYLRIAKRPSV
jgi:glycosyltransferase involved in cell wall biosynthesis